MSDRERQLREAFAKGNSGDRRGAMSDFAQDYAHHSNILGDIKGLDEYFEKWMPMIDALNTKQDIVDVVEHGNFVICTVTVTSDLSAEPKSNLHVYRWDGDQIVELWSIIDPT